MGIGDTPYMGIEDTPYMGVDCTPQWVILEPTSGYG